MNFAGYLNDLENGPKLFVLTAESGLCFYLKAHLSNITG